MSGSNTGSVDLESVLNVRRRTLASIGEKNLPRSQLHYNDTIYLKREDDSNSLLSIDSKVLMFGELQFLYTIFERYTSNIVIYEDEPTNARSSSPPASTKTSFPKVDEDEPDEEGPPIVSTMRKVSLSASKSPSYPPKAPDSPTRRRVLSVVGRAPSTASTSSEVSLKNLDGKRYGCIEVPQMSTIEILEILYRSHLELVNVSSGYDEKNVLHQNFVFSKTRPVAPKSRPVFPRSTSFAGS